MTEDHKRDELSQEEIESLHAEALPQREAMSVLHVPFLGAAPVDADEGELFDE